MMPSPCILLLLWVIHNCRLKVQATDKMTGELPSTLHTVIAFTCDLQGESRIMWSCLGISFENTPFEVVRKETRESQFGPHYFKKRENI